MRYLVRAKVKSGCEAALRSAIEQETLGIGSVAGGEYLRNMRQARIKDDGTVCWVEVCYCETPLNEERDYWESYFELVKIQDAHARKNCRDANGIQPWACADCDCTDSLEASMQSWGIPFLQWLKEVDD